jgi:hypothetical protein
MSFESKPASRGSVKPLIGLYSESGGGKSMSALLLARGLVGPNGNIQQIDTEAGRGELYSDVIPGGYNSIRMSEPFSPARYIEAVRYAEGRKADVIVIDQISNAWEGIGGVLDMAVQNEEAGRKGLSVWKAPKMEHAKMMVRLLQSPCPIIVCLRAKHKSRQVKQNGKTEIVKDDFTTPIQADDFIYEMTAHGELLSDHTLRLTKCSHPSLGACFPKQGMITIQHGESLAHWCANPGGNGSSVKPPTAGGSPTHQTASRHLKPSGEQPKQQATEKTRAWMLEELIRIFPEDVLGAYAIDKALILPVGESLRDWPLEKVATSRVELVDLTTDINKWKGGQ